MTSWEAQVVAAMARLILKIEERTSQDTNEHIDMSIFEDRSLLQEYVNRIENNE